MTQLSQTLAAQLTALLVTLRCRVESARRDERGNVTLEVLLWAIAIVAVVGIATAALTGFIQGKTGLLR
jgi:heme/copper-type cytochrome/quinol oxidase subunit 2